MTAKEFKKELEGGAPVLVEYWAPWCVYCRRIGPVMEKVARQYEGRVTVGMIDIDEEPLLAQQEQIEVVPTLVLYREGRAEGSLVAPESKTAVDAFLGKYLK